MSAKIKSTGSESQWQELEAQALEASVSLAISAQREEATATVALQSGVAEMKQKRQA